MSNSVIIAFRRSPSSIHCFSVKGNSIMSFDKVDTRPTLSPHNPICECFPFRAEGKCPHVLFAKNIKMVGRDKKRIWPADRIFGALPEDRVGIYTEAIGEPILLDTNYPHVGAYDLYDQFVGLPREFGKTKDKLDQEALYRQCYNAVHDGSKLIKIGATATEDAKPKSLPPSLQVSRKYLQKLVKSREEQRDKLIAEITELRTLIEFS